MLTEFQTTKGLLIEVAQELDSARIKHAPMVSPHEGYAVILEELDELWDEVKKWRGSAWKGVYKGSESWDELDAAAKARMRAEAIQIAAMALRFALDVAQ